MLQLNRILRAILKYKTSAGLTLASLIISFLGVIILTLYVSFEKSFDQFHKNAKSVYRLETKSFGSQVPAVLTGLISEKVPEVEKLTTFSFQNNKVTTPKLNETNTRIESSVLFADNSFFDMFTFPLTLGNQKTALTEPNTIVISESLANKLYGKSNPMGESILINDETFKITAVMNDLPEYSSLYADCIASFETYLKDNRHGVNQWSEWSYNIFLQLKSGSDPVLVAEKIEQIPGFAETTKQMRNQYPDEAFMLLRPLNSLHFIPDNNYRTTNPVILNVLKLLIVILTLMGAVNFINFASSQAPLRSKALSVLQIMGSKRITSMRTIILESVVLSILAVILALAIHTLIYSSIERLFGISGLDFSERFHLLLWFFLFAISFGVLAGIYPSWYVTSTPIHQAIKGNAQFSGKGKTFRNTLVTIQFVFTITLLISASFIEKQLHYWQNYNLGIDKEHVVFLRITPELQKHYQVLADELLKNDNISDYTYSQFIPGNVGMGWGRKLNEKYINIKCWPVDDNFIDFFGVEIVDGRKFQKNSEADINSFILNEKAVEQIGWENPVEEKIEGFGFNGQVVGVAKNFNFSSLKDDIVPMQLWRTNTRKNVLMLRLTPGNITQTFSYIKQTAQKFDSQNNFEIEFLDDALNRLYQKEKKIARFIEFVAMWCMLLAITGLFGLVIFICRDRTKEIGIRKVNGAKVSEILALLNKDFIKWVVIAFTMATPIAYYAMIKWLESFAYKTSLSWWIFALAGLLALGIALLTISWQSWRAATRNPVEALRYE